MAYTGDGLCLGSRRSGPGPPDRGRGRRTKTGQVTAIASSEGRIPRNRTSMAQVRCLWGDHGKGRQTLAKEIYSRLTENAKVEQGRELGKGARRPALGI